MKKKFSTFNAICKAEKIDFEKMTAAFKNLPKEYKDYMINHLALVMIIKALNKQAAGKDWEPKYDGSETRYEVWCYAETDAKHPSGFGLSFYVLVLSYSCTVAGARFAFFDRETALHAIKKFKPYFIKDRLIIK